MTPLAVSNGEVILIVVLVAAPIAALAFAGAGAVYREIGKGTFAMDRDAPGRGENISTPAGRAAQQVEIRQMLEAKAYRQRQRGEAPLDVEAELHRIVAPSPRLGGDVELVAEVRRLVVARNWRRERRGREPLDVEAEVARRLADLERLDG